MAAARGHTPNKHAGIEIMLLHADTVAEEGATRKRTGRIDSDNAHGVSLLAHMGSKCGSDGAFAGARRSRNAHAVPSAEGRGNTSHHLWDLSTVPFDVRHELCQRPLLTSKHPLNESHSGRVLHGGVQGCHSSYVGSGRKKTGRDQGR